jgi:hypothetical protein
MSSPNIVAIGTVIGFTTVKTDVTTSEDVILSSSSTDSSVLKLNNIIVANKTASSANITVAFRTAAGGGGTKVLMANATPVAAYSTLVIIDKASAIYLEENKSVTVESSASNSFDVVASFEKIQ